MIKFLSIALFSATITASAQQPVTISVGGGSHCTSSAFRESNHLGNGYNLHANVFIPFLNSGNGRFALGVLAGGSYYTMRNGVPDAAPLADVYKLYNGSLNITSTQNGGTASNGFTGSAGLQANIKAGPLVLSPSVSGGYFSFKQDGFAQGAPVAGPNGTTQNVTLFDIPATTKTGFITSPQLKISYPITNAFSVYSSAAINMGPTIDAGQRALKPQGGFNDKHTYETSQLTSGTMISRPGNACYQTMMINAGVSWSVGRRKQGKTFGESVAGGLQQGGSAMVTAVGGMKPGGAVSSSYAAGRLAMTPTTPKQTQSANFGEKSSNPLYQGNNQSGQNPLYGSAMARPGNPIPGVVVKGGKSPGAGMITVVSNDKGEFELNGLEAGSYQFTLTAPESQQKNSFGEKVADGLQAGAGALAQGASAARPGNPIGGIIVKGGKNPGGGMTNLSVGQSGEIKFEVLEPGNYKFIIQTPGGTQQQRKKVVEKATSGLKDTLKTNV